MYTSHAETADTWWNRRALPDREALHEALRRGYRDGLVRMAEYCGRVTDDLDEAADDYAANAIFTLIRGETP